MQTKTWTTKEIVHVTDEDQEQIHKFTYHAGSVASASTLVSRTEIRINKDTRLSDVLHVLLHMAQVDELLTSEVLAKSMGTNPAVFRRTMAGLREAGHVHSGKGHGGGWRLARPLNEITLLDVYKALDCPTLFAIGNRSERTDCMIQRNVNAALSGTMAQAEALFIERFGEVTLDTLLPANPASSTLHLHEAG